MGILRVILALSVIVAHVGPLFGLRFFGNGVMSVESFYVLSGFYMALVCTGRYRNHLSEFYFNRFLRLFPIYWFLVVLTFVLAGLYWLGLGHPLNPLVFWQQSHPPGELIWAGLSNLTILGIDWAELRQFFTSDGHALNRLIAIEPAWSLAVELSFYLWVPFFLRLRLRWQAIGWLLALLLRTVVWWKAGCQWTPWNYYFAPTAWVFFLTGVGSFHLMRSWESRDWFKHYGSALGFTFAAALVLGIVLYHQIGWLTSEDWRFFAVLALSIPFIFHAFRNSSHDLALGNFSYPLYLAHWVILETCWSPLRHYVAAHHEIYCVLILTLLLSVVAMAVDRPIQRRFKRVF